MTAALVGGCTEEDRKSQASERSTTSVGVGAESVETTAPTVADLTVPRSDDADLDKAQTAVAELRPSLPFSDEVIDCLTRTVAADGGQLAIVREAAPDDSASLEPIIELAQDCVLRTEAAPLFASELQRMANGALSAEQLQCAAEAYLNLSDQDRADLSAAAIDPAATPTASGDPTASILSACTISLPGIDP